MLKRIVRWCALRHGWLHSWYVRLCRPHGMEYAQYLRRHGSYVGIGEQCSINYFTNVTDPYLVRVGNNVTLSGCTLLGHDAIVRVLNNAYGVKLDSVGPIDIRDNCFVGHGAIVMPGVVIGPNAVVAAGALVTRDVPAGAVVGGVPARTIGTMEGLVERLRERSATYPWREWIDRREGAFDPAMELKLRALRQRYFFPDATVGHMGPGAGR